MIVVVGLAFEARIAAVSGLQVICSGDGNDLTPRLHGAIAVGCRGLISFGVAGGLHADLRAGTSIVASAVVAGGRFHKTNAEWSRKLLRRMPDAVTGTLAGASGPVTTAAAKRTLHRETGALAVDTESHIVAEAATSCGLPLVAIRVVCDPATRNVPELALRSIRADGSTDVASLLRALYREPAHIPGLLRVAFDARAARASLLRCVRALEPDLEVSDALRISGEVVGLQSGFGTATGQA
jgi:hopanoid-associated phosphorylase